MTGKDLENIIKLLRFTNTEAASILGVTRQTLYTWIGRAELKEKDVLTVTDKLKPYLNYNEVAEIINLAATPPEDHL